jgi:hypothetical protein
MSEPTSNGSQDRRRLLVVAVTAAAVLALAEWGSTRLVSPRAQPPGREPTRNRPDNVVILPQDSAALPAARPNRSVWILGNSHTYALPGLKPGDPLRVDEDGILIDELSAGVTRRHPDLKADFYLLSYPNFLPFEMLTRVGQLLYEDYRPEIVIVGVTWRNVARDSQLRHQVYTAYRDAEFAGAFERMLADPSVNAGPDVLEAVRSQRRRVEHDEQAERLKSDADKIDEVLTAWAGSHLTLMSKSAELRAELFRTMTERVQEMWSDRATVEYSYDLVDHDYRFNLDCLWAMLRLLSGRGATVVCYFAPERSDLPLLMDPQRQNEFVEAFGRQAAELGIVVMDARGVVPNEYWGWVGDSPDRSHFTEPGHRRLAEFLFQQMAGQSLWEGLAEP